MLETKSLVKIYKPKKGVSVKALDGVDLKFADTGMVFILGKSGSGKSTLLNVLGGLDNYDSGEIIIKGVSSKKFRQSHFDSYRNTYVGFIFQEYNVLQDFTVGANIALALELQGKKATDEEIKRILNEVDLAGHGNRRPNELSGGQKQRVAIARALVKQPKIIMADEPTGALDSNTGKQVFNTLKKLSETKLVIVVSHDRDFATQYADRIIELADGKVISDVSISKEANADADDVGISFDGNSAKIPYGYHLTEEDRLAINKYIDSLNSGLGLKFTTKTSNRRFTDTDNDKITSADTSPFKLIKSKLSLRHAFKMGASGLKYKKFRLVMTILLSCVAFVLFGLADTFTAYNHINTCTNSIYDTGIKYAALTKAVKKGDEDYEYWRDWNVSMEEEDIEKVCKDTGIEFKGVVANDSLNLGFLSQLNDTSKIQTYYRVYAEAFNGIVEVDEEDINKLGYKILSGKMPDGKKDEIAISAYIFESFKRCGYLPSLAVDEKTAGGAVSINDYSDMVGKQIGINGKDYTVTAVIDTKFNWDRYAPLWEDDILSEDNIIINFILYEELNYATTMDYTGLLMVGEGKTADILQVDLSLVRDYNYGLGINDLSYGNAYNFEGITFMEYIDKSAVMWLDGEREVLANNEIIVSRAWANGYGYGFYNANGEFSVDTEKLNGTANFEVNIVDYNAGDMYSESDCKIVGIIDEAQAGLGVNHFAVMNSEVKKFITTRSVAGTSFALGVMPSEKSDIKEFVEYIYTVTGDVKYILNNPVCFELDTINEMLKVLSKVFMYIGIGFALFAAILLSNFIATSISYKKQEIGILRAIGSRGNDVFRIFFAESFIIAMINFTISTLGVYAVTSVINSLLREEVGILITILSFGIRQVVFIFTISVAVAAIASYLPVKKIASKRPIDAIKNL